MKKNIFKMMVFMLFINCKAQNPIIPRFDTNQTYGSIQNAYYKDIDNYFDQFEGTWSYNYNNTTLKVTFLKKELMYMENSYFEDYLIGEFQYIENGIEIANTLPNLNYNHISPYDYNLYSSVRIDNENYPKCNTCSINEQRLVMTFDEPTNDDALLEANFIMRRAVENGVEKIKVTFIMTSSACGFKKDSDGISTSREHSIPYGEYTLIKQ